MNRAYLFKELRSHAPFTALGTLSGILFLLALLFFHVPSSTSSVWFGILHPFHVFLSAWVTAAMFSRQGGTLWRTLWVGYLGSVGIATLSDCFIPFVGEWLLDMPRPGLHVGFIENWWLVNPLALAGIAVGAWKMKTHISHTLHVWISTWASLLHIAMAMGNSPSLSTLLTISAFLFLAVWLPCCTSDIIFPLLFTPRPNRH